MFAKLFLIELKDKVKSGLIWSFAWILLGLIMAVMFEPMRTSLGDGADEIMKMFPPEMLESFNIGEDYLTKVESFIGGEFLTFFLLAGSIFAVFLGTGTIAGKIMNKTITNTMTKAITRRSLYITKVLTNLTYFLLTDIIIAAGVYACFSLSTGDGISVKFFASSFFAAFVLQSFFAVFGQVLGVIITAKPQMIGAVFAGFTWFMDTLSKLKGYPKFLQYVSPFYYLHLGKITEDFAVDWSTMSILIGLTLLLFALGIQLWERKDVYV